MVPIEPVVYRSVDDGAPLGALYTNQYVVQDGKAFRFDGTSLVPTYWRTKLADFKPKNVEQRCLFDLLDNDAIPVKVVKGVAGSGKTKCTMQFALAKVLDGKTFDRYLVVRNPVAVGEEIGYIKGDTSTKLSPWQSAICDNLPNGRKDFDYLSSKGALEFDIPASMQGRDLKRTFIHVTEAQMLTLDQLKMLGTRVSEGSVIVFEGDDEQVLNRKYVENNGLRQVVDKLAGDPCFGYMRLTTSVRSQVAEMFGKRL